MEFKLMMMDLWIGLGKVVASVDLIAFSVRFSVLANF